MSDDAPILGVQPADELPPEAEAPELMEPAPAEPDDLGPVRLDRAGRRVIEQALRAEGEIVRALRGVPAGEPEAWRWTDEEISALMPAIEALAERYGISVHINRHAPNAGAALVVAMHVNRSLRAERAWAAHTPPEETDGIGPRDQPAGPGEGGAGAGEPPAPEPAGEQPGAGLGPAELARVADHLTPGIGGGR